MSQKPTNQVFYLKIWQRVTSKQYVLPIIVWWLYLIFIIYKICWCILKYFACGAIIKIFNTFFSLLLLLLLSFYFILFYFILFSLFIYLYKFSLLCLEVNNISKKIIYLFIYLLIFLVLAFYFFTKIYSLNFGKWNIYRLL